jgi:hypothetical protein
MNCHDIQRFVKDGRIVWTMTTVGYTRYTLNLSRWLTTVAKVPWTLCVVCCDKDSELFFRREKVPYISWNGEGVRRTQDGMAAFGTTAFEKCNRQKLSILEWFCLNYSACGISHSLYLDGDIVVRTDPWPLVLPVFGHVDILFQCDCDTMAEHGPENKCENTCTGVIATRHTDSQAALYAWEQELWEKVMRQDQPFVTKRLLARDIPYKILDRHQFGNGFWMKSGQWKGDDWCLLHYNFLVSSSKRTALKENGHWLVA